MDRFLPLHPSKFFLPSQQVWKNQIIADMRLTRNKIYRPIKKKSGVIAGIARAGGWRDSSVGYGAMDSTEEVRKHTPTRNLRTSPSSLLAKPNSLLFLTLKSHHLCVPLYGVDG